MPPTYKPLTSAGGIQGAPGLPAEIFAPPPNLSFEDAEKNHMLLRAQEILNGSNDLALQEKQRIIGEQNQMREAIKAQFGGQDTFDPDQALQLAQKLALQSGDLDTALNVERVTRERSASSTPYGEAERALLSQEFGSDLPAGLSPSFMNTLINLRGKNLYADQLENTQGYRQNEKEARLFPGWEGNPTKKNSEKFGETLIGVQTANNILDSLSDSIARSGGEAATGPEYVMQRQLVGDLALLLKSPAFGNLGAALSPSEYQLLLTQLPVLISTPETSLGRVLVERGLGRDPADAIRALKSKLGRVLDVEAPIRGYHRTTGETPSSILQSPMQMQQPAANMQAPSGLPRQANGQPLTREQFQNGGW